MTTSCDLSGSQNKHILVLPRCSISANSILNLFVRFDVCSVTKPPNLCIVLEFVARGSLYDLLQVCFHRQVSVVRGHSLQISLVAQGDDPLSGEVMLVILKGVCAGCAWTNNPVSVVV
jgi:hypothetical protein